MAISGIKYGIFEVIGGLLWKRTCDGFQLRQLTEWINTAVGQVNEEDLLCRTQRVCGCEVEAYKGMQRNSVLNFPLFMIFNKLFKEHHRISQLTCSVYSDCCLLACAIYMYLLLLLFSKFSRKMPVQNVFNAKMHVAHDGMDKIN